jgi:LmbE family N-acetylglucosaminyl deacetylase
MTRRAFAIAAHPDDIEFMMAGTLILLGRAGYELHYMTVANGSCGTAQYDVETIARIRWQEAMSAAAFIGAVYHESLVNDIEIFYERGLLRRLSAVVREVAPEIILTHSTGEYMEDHANTCRLALTAAFTRGMRNYPVEPPRPPIDQPVTAYHALPYGLRDPLCRRVRPGMYVDVSDVMQAKREMLALHASQKEWLDASQGLNSYLKTMEDMCREVGRASGRYEYAEGWTRHLHLGYCEEDADPLAVALPGASYVVQSFEEGLG